MKKLLKKLTPFISIVFFGFALWFLNQKLRAYDIGQIMHQLSSIPVHYIVFSLVLSALSYLLLTAYDALGVHYIGEELETGKIIRAGYVGYAFSHNMGLALLSGGSIRYRIYSSWGFSGLQVTQIVGFSAFTLWIGFCSVAGLSLLFATPDIPQHIISSYLSLRVIGALLLLMLAAYIWACAKINREISIKSWSFTFPDLDVSLLQIFIASADWLLAASVLYVLLPAIGINYFSFVGVFLLAQIAGLFSQIPGGLGVFESVILVYLSNFMPGSEVLGILVVYRIIYYIIPLLGGLMVLAYQEYITNRKKVKKAGKRAASWAPNIVPRVMSLTVFMGGAMLLFSGVLPSEVPRMYWLQHFIPLPVIEMSHFFASLVGAAMLVLAAALQRRVDAAYLLTAALLVFGIIFSLLKGGEYEEAIILAVMLLAMIPCRQEFKRKARLIDKQFSTEWFVLIMMVLGSAVWLGVFSYRNVEYQKNLWWQFSLLGDAPRYLRAMVAALAIAVITGLVKLLRPKKPEQVNPGKKDLHDVHDIIQKEGRAQSNLAFLRDKELLFNTSRTSFLMFKKQSRSWITLGDPVGSAEEGRNLIKEFYQRTTEKKVSPVFYDVSSAHLELYKNLGLSIFKIGEEAFLDLTNNNIIQTFEDDILKNYKHLNQKGYHWKVLSEEELKNDYLTLKEISASSLKAQNRREKGFSRGYFDRSYLRRFPVAVAEKDGQIIAFSNILPGGQNQEFGIDMLRYQGKKAENMTDYMLVNWIQWAQKKDFQRFNLGLAPLAGMKNTAGYTIWNTSSNLVYRYGNFLYNFRSIKHYKGRFNPSWSAKFVACPGGMALPGVVYNLKNLLSDSPEV